MTFKHLLQSIVQEADHRVSDAKKAHVDRMQAIQAEHDRKLEAIRKNAQDRLSERKRSLKEKAESLGRISSSKLLLKIKNAEIDSLYDDVLDGLKKADENQLETFFKKSLEMAGEGTIHASKEHEALLKKLASKGFEMGEALPKGAGGFIVSTPTKEWNFTFDFLVRQSLRPATEIEAATHLFA